MNPHYLLLVQPVHLHPPQGLISMCCNLLKKYQTSPDMRCSETNYPLSVRHLSYCTVDDMTKTWYGMPWQTDAKPLAEKLKSYFFLIALTLRDLQTKQEK